MLKKILFIIDKKQKRNLVILMFMMLIGSFIELLGVSAIMPLVSVVTDNSIIETNEKYAIIARIFDIHDARTYVLVMALLLIIIYIIKNLYICLQYNFQYKFVFENQRRLSREMLDYYVHRDYLYHTATNVSVLQRNITYDANFCFDVILNMLQFTNEATVVVILVVYLSIVDYVSTISMGAILGVFLVIFVLFFRKYSLVLGEKTRVASAEQTKWLLQSCAGIKDIKVMNKEDYFIHNYDIESRNFSILRRKQSFAQIVPKPVMESVCICGLLTVMSIRIFMGKDMAEFVPMLSVFAIAAFRMLPSMNRLSGSFSAAMYGKSSLDNTYESVVEMRSNEKTRTIEENDNYEFTIKNKVSVNNLSFKYPAGEDNVLENVSFDIPRLKSVALIGPSGAGKSTMADLLLGVLTPDSGSISVDDVNIQDHMKSWHRRIGYIPQVIYLMDATIRENVAFGVPKEEIDDERVWEVLREVQLDDFVRQQPGELDAEVGDRGVRISGGQRQRIGIARALYINPDVLVLDEATSALDNDTETAVMEAIDALHGSRTMVIIAHRLTTIRNCDYIYEVKDKKIALRDKVDVLGEIAIEN